MVFRFVWENDADKYVVINASAFMALHGFCDVWSDGSVLGGSHEAGFGASLTLELIDYTNEPFLSLGLEDDVNVFYMDVNSGDVWDDPACETQYVAVDHTLEKRVVAVPPRTAVVIHTTARMSATTGQDSGRLKADFISYGWGLSVPGVLTTVLS